MIYVFDGYELDIEAHELRQAGVPVALTPKVYHVLVYLVQHHDRLVLKEELLERLWPGTFVDDSAVKRCITAARRAIGDQSAAPQRIKTLRGQGYRFIAPVTVYDRPPVRATTASTASSPSRSEGGVLQLQPARPLPAPGLREVRQPGHDEAVPHRVAGMRQCAACQADNSMVARFCIACGSLLVMTCAHCGQVVSLPALFCQACGQRLVLATPSPPPSAPAPSPARSLPITERKLVTALCGMLVYTPALLEGTALDDMHRLMQAMYEFVCSEMQRYAGTLLYLTGDGFLAIFGAPVAQEDHAWRAVLGALGLQGRWCDKRTSWQLPTGETLAIRMALHTGLVIVGQLPQEAGGRTMVVGDVTTLAAALARRAAPDTVVASDATLRLVQERVRTAALAPLQVDTHPTPIPVAQILQALPQRAFPTVNPARARSPFVGRDTELAVLQARLAFIERSQGQVVGIVGEPGMGKSRLLYEFRQEITTRQAVYLQGDCQSYGSAIPYLPLCDLLRTLWDMRETDSPATITAQVRAGLQAVALEPDAWAPALLHMLGVETTLAATVGVRPELLRARTFEALHRLLLHSSWRQPHILEIENLHWIDATSEAYLAALVERLVGVPLLLLVTFRPGYQPSWLDKSYATRIALQPLGHPDSRKMVRTILRHTLLTVPVERQLLSKAQGNPFFLEELAQTVREQPGRPPVLTVPDTVQAVIAARMDRLLPEEKQLLQAAAVIGTEVPLPLLQTVAGLADNVLRDRLTQLQAVEFLYETRFEPERTYTFKHVLTHEVAYGSLLQEQRQTLHQRIVEALEAWPTERQADQLDRLAHHALRGELWEKACQYFWRAGLKAMARSASQEAVVCFEQALAALRHVPEERAVHEQRIDICLNLHHALMRLGNIKRCFEVLHQVAAVAEEVDDARRLGWISSYLSTDCLLMGDANGAIAAGQRALALATVCDDTALQSDAQLHLGQAYHAISNYRQAIAILTQNVAALEQVLCQEQVNPADLLNDLHGFAWLIWCLAETGAFAEGRRYGAQAIRGAEILDQPFALVVAYGAVGLLYLRQGDVHQAIPRLERSLSLCQAADIPLMLPTVAANMGAAYALAGRLADALPLLEQAVAQAAAHHLLIHHALQVASLSEAYLLAGRKDEAQTLAEHALELSRTRKERGYEAYALRLLGAIAAQRFPGAAAPAAAFYQQALALAHELGMQPLLAHCHLGLGMLYGQAGQVAQARVACAAAIALFRSMEMTFWLLQAEAALARMR